MKEKNTLNLTEEEKDLLIQLVKIFKKSKKKKTTEEKLKDLGFSEENENIEETNEEEVTDEDIENFLKDNLIECCGKSNKKIGF